jgi:hypothetical protein
MTFLEIKITCDHPACDRTLSTLPINPDEVLEAVECEVKACHWTAVPSSPSTLPASPLSPVSQLLLISSPVKHFCPEHSSKLVTP